MIYGGGGGPGSAGGANYGAGGAGGAGIYASSTAYIVTGNKIGGGVGGAGAGGTSPSTGGAGGQGGRAVDLRSSGSSLDVTAGTVAGGAGGIGGAGGSASGTTSAQGGAGGNGGNGGDGIYGYYATLTNAGSMLGGDGAVGGSGGNATISAQSGTAQAGAGGQGGVAGTGVRGQGFSLYNSGTISGGAGGTGGAGGYGNAPNYNPGVSYGTGVGGAGGDGAAGGDGVAASHFSLSNSGVITGGAGGDGGAGGKGGGWSSVGGDGGQAGEGGAGVSGTYFTLSNDGSITGGAGGHGGLPAFFGHGTDGGIGGAGIIGYGMNVSNAGTITGGVGGTGGLGILGTFSSGDGGAGIDSLGGASYLSNDGTVTGGTGGHGIDTSFGGSSLTAANKGRYAGGNGGMGVGAGTSGFHVNNRNTIAGGDGGAGGDSKSGGYNYAGDGGIGGAGIGGSGFVVSNGGSITGGGGGLGGFAASYDTGEAFGYENGGDGGTGGAGVSGSGFTLTNTGTVRGGSGGDGGSAYSAYAAYRAIDGIGGVGGAGVVSTGGSTVVTSGLIAGGVSGKNGDGTGGGVQADAVDFSGGGNTLELQAGYSFTGNVISTSGTTSGGDTLTLGGAGNATFNLSQVVGAMPTTYGASPVFFGFNQYAKTGTSTWTLTGTNADTESWTVSAGKLEVGDAAHPGTTLNGSVTLAGGTLGGHGSITGDVTNDAGTVQPGGTVGILTVSGNYVQGANGTLVIEITPDPTPGTGSSELLVGGTATLDGALGILMDPGTYLKNTYTLVHAGGGVSGTFANVSFTPGLNQYITGTVTYTASDVLLDLNPTARAYTSGVPNAASAVSLGAEQTFATVLGHLGPTAQGRQGVWGQFTAGRGGLGQGSRYQYNGTAAGYGRSITDRFVLGLAVAGGTATTTLSPTKVVAKPIGGFVYGIWRSGRWRMAGSLGTGRMSQDTQRFLGGVDSMQSAFGHGRYTGAALRLDYTAKLGGWQLTPYAGADVLNARYDGATEQGMGLLALTYGKVSQHLGHYQAGLKLGAQWGGWHPWIRAGTEGWRGDRAIAVTETLGGFSSTLQSSPLPGNAFSGGAGVNYHRGRWDTSVSWHGAWGSNFHANDATLQVRYRW